MKHLYKIFFLILIAANIYAQPKIYIDKIVDLGVVKSGDIKTKSIYVANDGTENLKISSVSPSSGYRVVNFPKEILPKQSNTIDLEFNSKGYIGIVEKFATIVTNDPSAKTLAIKLIARVERDIKNSAPKAKWFSGESSFKKPKILIEPSEINLGEMYSGEKKKGVFIIKNIGEDTLKSIMVEPTCGCTAVKQPLAQLAPKQSDSVEIEFNSTGYSSGIVEKHISVMSSDPENSYISTKIIVSVKEELKFSTRSSYLWFDNAVKGKEVEKSLYIINATNKDIKIKGYNSEDDQVKVTINKKKLLANDLNNNIIIKAKDSVFVQVKLIPDKIKYDIKHINIITDAQRQKSMLLNLKYIGAE